MSGAPTPYDAQHRRAERDSEYHLPTVRVTGIYLSITTGSQAWAATDDPLYLGLAGTVGGREFFIAPGQVRRNATTTFKWGEASFNADVETASMGGTVICRPNLTHVYLRKLGLGSRGADNAFKLESAFVFIAAEGLGTTDVYVTTGPEQLSYETGLIVYFAQTAHLGEYMNKQIPVLSTATNCGDEDDARRRADVVARAAKRGVDDRR